MKKVALRLTLFVVEISVQFEKDVSNYTENCSLKPLLTKKYRGKYQGFLDIFQERFAK